MDLRWQRFTLEWKEKRLDKLDEILRKNELNLQYVANNFKESRRSISSNGSSNKLESAEDLSNDVWEPPSFTDDIGRGFIIQTSINPFNCLVHSIHSVQYYYCDHRRFLGVQTEDPFSALDSVLGPMIAYRATGESPNMSQSEELIQLIARGDKRTGQLKVWIRFVNDMII